MQKRFDTEGVVSAIDLLREQLQETISQIRECVVGATEEGNYDEVRQFIEKAETLDRLKLQVEKLLVEFAKAFPLEPNSPPPSLPGITLAIKKKHCHAKANYQAGSVIVLEGSILSLKEFDSLPDPIRDLRNKLKRRGKLIQQESRHALVLSTDYKFKSPSAAACFVLGYSANGKREWIVEGTGRHLGEE